MQHQKREVPGYNHTYDADKFAEHDAQYIAIEDGRVALLEADDSGEVTDVIHG